MQKREQVLAYALGVFVVLYFGLQWLHSTFIGPIERQRETLAALQKGIEDKTDKLIFLSAQRAKLEKWNSRSLPPDSVKAGVKAAPSALNAQRLYQEWLHDLALMSGFEDLALVPDKHALSPGNIYVAVGVKIEADARYDQLCRFLDRFYRARLLHRVSSLRVISKDAEGNPFLRITLHAEGLAIAKAPENNRLFPQTVLMDDLSEDATVLHIESAKGFPTKPGFRVKLRSEFLLVTAVDGTTWTVERGRDETTAASQPTGSIVELTPVLEGYVERTSEEFKQLIETNIFVKPAPPTQYNPKFGPLGEKVFTRGKPIEFSVVLIGFDATKGRPEFSLVSPENTGMRIDRSTGKFTWSPSEQKVGTYPIKFEAKHPSAIGGKLQGSVNLVVREANSPPKISAEAPPIVYIGRDWKFNPTATDGETPSTNLMWKLGDNSPPGLAIDPKTGELKWTPDDAVEAGPTTVQVTVTDDGTPPLSTSLSLNLKVEDDLATFTRLTSIFINGDDRQARFFDRSRGKGIELRVGNQFAVAEIKGTITKIEKKYLLFNDGVDTRRIEPGQNLRETTIEKSELPDSTGGNIPATQAPTETVSPK